MRKRLLMGALLTGLLAVSGCGGGKAPARMPALGDHSEPSGPGRIVQEEPKPIAGQMAGKEGIIQMVMTEQGFEPSEIPVRAGQTVRIYLRNAGTKEHNFVVPRFGIRTSNMAPGAENYVEFTPGVKGVWPFFSDAPGPEEPGLAGQLRVE